MWNADLLLKYEYEYIYTVYTVQCIYMSNSCNVTQTVVCDLLKATK